MITVLVLRVYALVTAVIKPSMEYCTNRNCNYNSTYEIS
jgi:hypothetical protein